MRGLRENTYGSHHFTLPYCPWTYGTVEFVCRELIRAMRELLFEFRMPFKMWPRALPPVQALLNSAPLHRLGNRAPIKAFTALPPESALYVTLITVIKNKSGQETSTLQIDTIHADQVAQIDKVLLAVEGMHRQFTDPSKHYPRFRT